MSESWIEDELKKIGIAPVEKEEIIWLEGQPTFTNWFPLARGPYVDVRGLWPVLVNGIAARELRGAPRSITVAEAQVWVAPEIIPDS